MISLVITIIVLLILATISITTLMGENGIITKANTAKTNIEKANIEEQLQMAVIASYDQNGNLNMNKLKEELAKVQGDITITDTNEGNSVKVIVDGYTFEIDEGGSIIPEEGNQGGETPNPPVEETGITAKDIANSTNKSEYYGATVTGYECPNSTGINAWKIFYADSSNIYLIADDYIRYDYCPSSPTGEITKYDDYKLSMKGNMIINYQNGSEHITDAKIKALNNDYFNVKKYSSTRENMKAVAYMLDANVWKVFQGDKAEFAIGGPTIEMLMKSYSQKYNVDYRAQAGNSIGYHMSNDGGTTWFEFDVKFSESDDLYMIRSIDRAFSMWIASPCMYDPNNKSDKLLVMAYNGTISENSYDGTLTGFRPVVCLNSNVELEKNSNGTYHIK